MLKKQNRLLKDTKFTKQDLYASPFFILKIAQNDKELSRFGFVVSKKIDTRAVVRNRIKRQTRVCIENNLEKIASGYDVLFILKKEILEKLTSEIDLIVLTELKKRNLII